jgi:hypothetical protein
MATVVLHLIIQSNSLPVQCSLLAGLVYLIEVNPSFFFLPQDKPE